MGYVTAQRATANESQPRDASVCVWACKNWLYAADVIKQNVSNNLKLFSECVCLSVRVQECIVFRFVMPFLFVLVC